MSAHQFVWSSAEECPHRLPYVCRQCDCYGGWYYADNYPDCPWRITDDELTRNIPPSVRRRHEEGIRQAYKRAEEICRGERDPLSGWDGGE